MDRLRRAAPLILVISTWGALVFELGVAGSDNWWFEDDPIFFSEVAKQASPAAFFADRHVIQTGGTALNELVPMMFVSFWLDAQLAPRNATFAYLHSAMACLAAALLLYAVGAAYVGRSFAALGAIAWLLLPSTHASGGFLSARCYVEGLVFAIVAVHQTERYLSEGRTTALVVALVATVLSLCSKEYFVAALPLWLGLRLLQCRRWPALLELCLVAAAYAAYRWWAVGLSVQYSIIPLPTAREIVDMFAVVPYRLWYLRRLGYLLFGLVGLGTCYLWWREPALRGALVFVSAICLVSVATILPVSHGYLLAGKVLCSSTRTPFVLNLLVVSGTVLVAHSLWHFRTDLGVRLQWRRVLAITICGVLLLGGMVGARQSVRFWNEIKAAYALEGRFFVSHPGVLLVSDLPATWYFGGLARLYAPAPTAAVITKETTPEEAARLRAAYDVSWHRTENGMEVIPPHTGHM